MMTRYKATRTVNGKIQTQTFSGKCAKAAGYAASLEMCGWKVEKV